MGDGPLSDSSCSKFFLFVRCPYCPLAWTRTSIGNLSIFLLNQTWIGIYKWPVVSLWCYAKA
ncbi:hypothetical protein BpHYR1_034930 [Brachionus plicatilis]|uniref:Uncharacterized protein n=1 Tax=Brachionus plicatilis TaxID=10195 RepID=A0A3M7S3R8_BRAPC|nr:hypothetical protein BpHYR1_034930 [Brachionus plicatilis]